MIPQATAHHGCLPEFEALLRETAAILAEGQSAGLHGPAQAADSPALRRAEASYGVTVRVVRDESCPGRIVCHVTKRPRAA